MDRRQLNMSLDGIILMPSKLNQGPQSDLIVKPQPILTKQTTESSLELLVPQLKDQNG